ncbi:MULTISPECIES: hypothetical protein [Algibacter]|uniref:Uncharacterized protein n=1 Tax=Algibacter lectus TaxID=221126 RepID=A0A090WZU3_9FLAO|nr:MULTISPECIES: hypothetical protein [Algibacter]MDO7135912.1 hypothetical protein [Algibacter lectus]GAL82645.1 hypothetical protein JCM19274_229 [Algibacter lectus]
MGKQEKKKPYLVRKRELREEYNVYVSAYGGYADDERERPAVEIFENVAATVSLKPSYLFNIAVGEGFGKFYLDVEGFYKDNKIQTNRRVYGFLQLGIDFFGSKKEYPRFEKYLPKDYNVDDEYKISESFRDEAHGEEYVPSATFKDLQSGIEAIAAVLKHREEMFIRAYKEFGYGNPSEDESAYWTYYFYQNETEARMRLGNNGGFNIFYSDETSRETIHIKALERVASWRYLLYYNIFSS